MICLKCYKFNNDDATKCSSCGHDLLRPDKPATDIKNNSSWLKSLFQRLSPIKLFPMKFAESLLCYLFFIATGLLVKLPLIQFGEGNDYAPLLLWYLGSFCMVFFITPIVPILFVLFLHVYASLMFGKITFRIFTNLKSKSIGKPNKNG